MLRPCKLIPRRPASDETLCVVEFCTLLQHCIEPVLHWLSACGNGEATARRAKEERIASCFANMVEYLVSELLQSSVTVLDTIEAQVHLYRIFANKQSAVGQQ